MMVPRSFKYGAAREFDEKEGRRKSSYSSIISARVPVKISNNTNNTNNTHNHVPRPVTQRPDAQSRAVSEPLAIPARPTEQMHTTPVMIRPNVNQPRSTSASKHRPDALSPSVAALLAMTAIPPRRSHRTRRRKTTGMSMSIDELVSHWKSDVSLGPGSPTMSVLLGDSVESVMDELLASGKASVEEPSFGRTRSTSSDSIPSLDADDTNSLRSCRSPSTPASLRSQRSASNLRREKFKSSSVGEACPSDHPLIFTPHVDVESDDVFVESFSHNRQAVPVTKTKSSFRSNLTTSLQVLKNAALSSLPFKGNTASSSREPSGGAGLADDALWAHPFLFPRLTSEIRPPSIQGTPTMAQRRYLNPMPLTFEEQEAPFQQALHAPYLAEKVKEAPLIQLQTYTRGRRRTSRAAARSKGTDAQSEAGRAQLLCSGIRQREARENAAFLRIVVLEMNMRRAGKLETGRAKIWLPARQVVEKVEEKIPGQVPARWVGICA